MARRTESRLVPDSAAHAFPPTTALEADKSTWPEIRRVGNGAIDIEYYEQRARLLRSRFIQRWMRILIRRLARLWRRVSTETELNALDDRALHDIGISRSDIPAIVSGKYFRDDSRRQRGRADRIALEDKRCSDRSYCLGGLQRKKGESAMTSFGTQHPRHFAESWISAWNRHDLDAVLAHYSDDFEFSSPLIRQFAGEASGRLVGKEAVRAYWSAALACLPDLRFELVEVLAGIDGLLILYRGHRGLAAEVFEFDANGQVRRGQALYAG
jgi:uncharacterized protein YjiS (DUF1127 family)/ketosteroid isomerase-like protein